MKSLRDYWTLLSTYLKPQRMHVFVLALVLVVSISLQLFTPRVLRDFIDLALSGADYASLSQTAMLFFGMVLLTQFASIGATYLSERVAWTATNLLRVDLAEHCTRRIGLMKCHIQSETMLCKIHAQKICSSPGNSLT